MLEISGGLVRKNGKLAILRGCARHHQPIGNPDRGGRQRMKNLAREKRGKGTRN